MCEACGHRAIGVADTMGFQLMSTTLDALERELATKALQKMGVGCELCRELGKPCSDCRNGLEPSTPKR
jgi:hypothetical protein